MTLLQLLTWKATSREASALAEGVEAAGVAGVVGEVVVLEVAEVVAEVIRTMAGAAAGVGGVDLGLLVKAKAAATGQAKHAEQQPEVN